METVQVWVTNCSECEAEILHPHAGTHLLEAARCHYGHMIRVHELDMERALHAEIRMHLEEVPADVING